MGFLNHVKLWKDVLDPALDEKTAPSLGGVHLGKEAEIYVNPDEFFKRTLITRHMAEALGDVVSALSGEGGSRIITLSSLFGGGKTHTLLTIYHAIRKPSAILEAKTEDSETRELVNKLVEKLTGKTAEGVRVVVLDGYFSELAPTPVNPLIVPGGYRVQTIWGSLAHQLGRFDDVRINDEKLYAPPVDVIMKLLEGRPVLILIDELVHYVVTLRSSGDQVLQNYADQVVAFIEALAKAVESSKQVVLVVSMPVEVSDRELVVEERYRSATGVVESIYRSIRRVASRPIMPVAPAEMPSVLRTRIFESIDDKVARAVSSTLEKLYSSEEWKEIFGEKAVDYAHKVEKTYPFHPSYIETLIDILDKHEVLEKTRDAIRITRMIIRKLAESKSDAELVMPFHIDVEDREIRSILFSHQNYRQFETIVSEDIVKKAGDYTRPELAKVIAKVILVKTFVYPGSKSYQQFYPDKHWVIVSSYEPAMARTLDLQPKDYVDALEWVSSNLVYLLSENDKYWFTQLVTPIRRVEMYSRDVSDREALKKVEEYAWKLLSKPAEMLLSGSRRRSEGEKVKTLFSVGSSKVLLEPKPVDNDSREYILLAVLLPLDEKDIEKLIYETSSGGTRRYANTVYLIYPRDYSVLNQMLSLAKYLIACGKVSEELELLYQDSDTREVMGRKLEKYCKGMDGIEGKLVVNILSGLNRVAYPSFDDERLRNTFGLTDASMADTIIETASRALRNTRPQKLYEELDFDMLHYTLSQIGIDISEGNSGKQVSDIVDYFYSNTRLPMVSDQAIKDALIDGVRWLKIGIRRSGKVYFKKIYTCSSMQECTPPQTAEGEAPSSLEANDIVLPWKIALREQLEALKDVKEERTADGIRKTWYGVYFGGSIIPVAKALEELDPETLRSTPIVMVSELIKEGVDVKLEKYETICSPGEELSIDVVVERVGSFKGEVSLSATQGELSPDKITIGDEKPSAKISWRIRAPTEPGVYSYELKALNSSGEALKSVVVKVTVTPKGRMEYRGIPPKGTKVSSLVVEVSSRTPNLKPVAIVDSRLGSLCDVEEAVLEVEAEIAGRRAKMSLRLEQVSTEDLKTIFPVVMQRYGILTKRVAYRIVLKPRGGEYIIAPEFPENDAKEIKDYIEYYVFEE